MAAAAIANITCFRLLAFPARTLQKGAFECAIG